MDVIVINKEKKELCEQNDLYTLLTWSRRSRRIWRLGGSNLPPNIYLEYSGDKNSTTYGVPKLPINFHTKPYIIHYCLKFICKV